MPAPDVTCEQWNRHSANQNVANSRAELWLNRKIKKQFNEKVHVNPCMQLQQAAEQICSGHVGLGDGAQYRRKKRENKNESWRFGLGRQDST